MKSNINKKFFREYFYKPETIIKGIKVSTPMAWSYRSKRNQIPMIQDRLDIIKALYPSEQSLPYSIGLPDQHVHHLKDQLFLN